MTRIRKQTAHETQHDEKAGNHIRVLHSVNRCSSGMDTVRYQLTNIRDNGGTFEDIDDIIQQIWRLQADINTIGTDVSKILDWGELK